MPLRDQRQEIRVADLDECDLAHIAAIRLHHVADQRLFGWGTEGGVSLAFEILWAGNIRFFERGEAGGVAPY